MDYDEKIDYGLQHLEFSKNNPSFIGISDYKKDFPNMYRMINDLPKDYDWRNRVFYAMHMGALRVKEKQKQDALKIKNAMCQSDDDYVFLTIGLDDGAKPDTKVMLRIAEQIMHLNGKNWVRKADYVLEKHRTNKDGAIYEHHHIHMLIVVKEPLRLSKILELIMKLKGIKKYVTDKQFIDVKMPRAKDFSKRAQPYPVCLQYVQGKKTNSKQKCIEMDREWRDFYEVEHLYHYEAPSEASA